MTRMEKVLYALIIYTYTDYELQIIVVICACTAGAFWKPNVSSEIF